jgi:putative flippase GtrA
MSYKINSLTIFFPFYNDEGTVLKQIRDAYEYGSKFTDDLEVIALHGGNSRDGTWDAIIAASKIYPNLKIVNKNDNKEGYAVIKHGFYASSKEWVFYTDGDAQYHLDDLEKLINKLFESNADIINGYKIQRDDNIFRIVGGNIYATFSTFIFDLPIRDTDCDFRLMKKSFIDKITFNSTDASILPEMIKKLELEGARFVEVPVNHYKRIYGESNYTTWMLFKEKLMGDITLYFKLRKYNPFQKLRIYKFAFVGLLSILVQLAYFNMFLIVFGKPSFLNQSYVAAFYAIIADQVAILSSFILNNHITFKDRKVIYNNSAWKKFFNLYIIIMISTGLQSLIIYLGNFFFGYSLFISNLFFILGTGFAFLWNYSFQKRFVYKR